jgi:hypothetical protein
MTEIEVYTVVHFGCNSTPNDMWIPRTRLFTDKDQAYTYYRSICPPYDEDWWNDDDDDEDDYYEKAYRCNLDNGGECIIQDWGYHEGYPNRAKRPYGALITVNKVSLPQANGKDQ